jgi:hypothetical protein
MHVSSVETCYVFQCRLVLQVLVMLDGGVIAPPSCLPYILEEAITYYLLCLLTLKYLSLNFTSLHLIVNN